MMTIPAVVRDGQIYPRAPVRTEGEKHCLVTVLEEEPEELRRLATSMLADEKQARLSLLLEMNKSGVLNQEQERELNSLLTEVQHLAAQRARAARLLEQLQLTQ